MTYEEEWKLLLDEHMAEYDRICAKDEAWHKKYPGNLDGPYMGDYSALNKKLGIDFAALKEKYGIK